MTQYGFIWSTSIISNFIFSLLSPFVVDSDLDSRQWTPQFSGAVIPPEFQNCPDNIVVAADAGECDAEADWTPPIATDDDGVEWWKDDDGYWWYREPGQDDWQPHD